MLKLFLCLALVGCAFAADQEFSWDRIPEAANASQCIYRNDTRTLNCRGAAGAVVECPAVLESSAYSPRTIEVFGLSFERRAENSTENIVPERFPLFPRDLDNSTYLDRVVEVEGRRVELFLYGAERTSEAGLRISDLKCYERLVGLFRESRTVKHEVQVGQQTVALFGEVLIANKPAQKRWLGWMGLWGAGLWGWGFGWGWPLWGGLLWG